MCTRSSAKNQQQDCHQAPLIVLALSPLCPCRNTQEQSFEKRNKKDISMRELNQIELMEVGGGCPCGNAVPGQGVTNCGCLTPIPGSSSGWTQNCDSAVFYKGGPVAPGKLQN